MTNLAAGDTSVGSTPKISVEFRRYRLGVRRSSVALRFVTADCPHEHDSPGLDSPRSERSHTHRTRFVAPTNRGRSATTYLRHLRGLGSPADMSAWSTLSGHRPKRSASRSTAEQNAS